MGFRILRSELGKGWASIPSLRLLLSVSLSPSPCLQQPSRVHVALVPLWRRRLEVIQSGAASVPQLIQDCMTAAGLVSQEHLRSPSSGQNRPSLALDSLLRQKAWQQWISGSPIAESIFRVLVRDVSPSSSTCSSRLSFCDVIPPPRPRLLCPARWHTTEQVWIRKNCPALCLLMRISFGRAADIMKLAASSSRRSRSTPRPLPPRSSLNAYPSL